ncbi:MAG: AAA family ATPase [Deltaproteobacteria bacterium]|nr:AAA family ATPase [Deltaproteobacteria bacterium]
MQCPGCRFENLEGMRFCGRCGIRLLKDDAPDPAEFNSHSERKQITALFSDITGYTALCGRIDPEEVRELTGLIFRGAAGIVAHYEGFIEGIVGDGILMLFGVPRSHGDDPIRAVCAAREIHEMVASLSPRYEKRIGFKLSLHSGINTGLAVTAEGTYGVSGEVTNVASRLSNLAQACEIVVGFDTYRACRNRFSFKSLKQTTIKGKTGSIPIYKLLSVKPSTSFMPDSVPDLATEIVGRGQVLHKLEKLLMKSVAGRGSVINLVGEAGIGKSRLISELKQRKAVKRVLLLEGQAISIGKNLRFHPVVDVLKRWALIGDQDADLLAFVKLDRVVRGVCPRESDEILPFLATLMGLQLVGRHAERVLRTSGEGLEKIILKSLQELFIQASRQQPVIVIIEDLHWADASSLRLLGSLYRLAEKHRVSFINLYRPGYLDDEGRSVLNRPGRYHEIQLRPLNERDSEKLIGRLSEGRELSGALRKRIVAQTGGNPFFIEEVVYSLLEDATRISRSWEVAIEGGNNAVVIPSTINDVLSARLDRLEELDRELVKIASVVGRNFFDRVIRDVAAGIDDLDLRLQRLKKARLILERERLQEVEYFFKHALVQEAAYGMILIPQRRMLHLRVAKSIEKLFSQRLSEFFGILAYHYHQGGDLEKTEEYLIKAGEESLRASASREALTYFQQALKMFLNQHGESADPAKLVALEKNVALAFCRKGLLVDGLRYYDRVLERLGRCSPGNVELGFAGDLLAVVARLYLFPWREKRDPDEKEREIFETTMQRNETLVIADTARSFPAMIRLLREAGNFDLGKTASGFRLWVGTGTVFSYMGISFRVARKFLLRSRMIGKHQRVEDDIAYHNSESMYRHCAGEWRGTGDYDQGLVDRCLKSGALFYVVPYSWSVGHIKVGQGKFSEAETIIDKLFEIAETYNHYQARLVALGLKSHLLFKIREFPMAEITADERLALAAELNVVIGQLGALGHKIMIKAMLGEVDAADKLIDRAESLIGDSGRLPPYCLTRYWTGRFLNDMSALNMHLLDRRADRLPELKKRARQSGRKALAGIRRYAPSGTFVLRLVGDYYWLVEDQSRAARYWQRALRKGEKMGARPDLARTCFEIGRHLLEPGSRWRRLDGNAAESYLERAGVMFEELGLKRDLEELKQFQEFGKPAPPPPLTV